MSESSKFERAVHRVHDQESFVRELLVGALDWPIGKHADSVEEIAYEWTEDELRAAGLNERVVGGKAYQIVLPGNPWGIFILEFRNPDLLTADRGMTGVLRRVLNGLVPKKRGARDARLAAFNRDNLLFICNHKYERYRFAHFKPPREAGGAAPMASFGWGPEDVNAIRTICEFNLESLVWPSTAPRTEEDWTIAWGSAFDVEKVTKRFYEDYAGVFGEVEELIAQSKVLKGDQLRVFTQSLFNRLMFLRFIERKGWLIFPGQKDTRYLSSLMAAGGVGGRSFFKTRLRPLFFEGLAEEGKQKTEAYGSVPWLNGGLFEESELDRKVTDLTDQAFGSIIGTSGLFYRYNFTVEESTPLEIDVAVDPEMLGRVFEELVTGRHESGSYYTPRPVVSFMCREALKGRLVDRIKAPANAIARLVDDHLVDGLTDAHAAMVLEALDKLKAVDPACGSGAYLLGLLQEMIAIRRALQSEKLIVDRQFLYKLKLHIISNNLYGVDIDPFATEIAKLRLWLSLAVEADKPIPLPNLDFKIETGDSLLGPNPQELPDLFRLQIQKQADLLVDLKGKHLTARGGAKKKIRDAILAEEAAIAGSLHAHLGPGVVDWRIQFADVFVSNGGFDVVLANPPYVNMVQMDAADPAYRATLKANFTATKGGFDLFVPFMERGVELTTRNGMFAYIVPNKLLSAEYATELRADAKITLQNW